MICMLLVKNKITGKNTLSYDYVKNFIETNSRCKFLSEEYVNVDTKLLLKCDCENEFWVSFYKFNKRNKRQCNICSDKIRRKKKQCSFENVKICIEQDGCQLLDKEYSNGNKDLTIQCSCGEIFQTSYSAFKQQVYKLCNTCIRKIIASKRRFSYNYIKNYVEIDSNSGCKLLSTEYNKTIDKLLFLCPCGEKFETSFDVFKRTKKYQCNMCGQKIINSKKTKSQEKYEKQIFDIVGNEYSVIGQYVGGKNPILMRHNKCGSEWILNRAQGFFNGNRCPNCAYSKAETDIDNFFKNTNYTYHSQYRIKECKDKRSLPFDFAILDNDNNLICLIEADGEQHFRLVYFGGISEKNAIENLKRIQKHDQIKNEYCKNNNIPLIRIPYWEFNNIINFLNTELIKLNIILLNKEIA